MLTLHQPSGHSLARPNPLYPQDHQHSSLRQSYAAATASVPRHHASFYNNLEPSLATLRLSTWSGFSSEGSHSATAPAVSTAFGPPTPPPSYSDALPLRSMGATSHGGYYPQLGDGLGALASSSAFSNPRKSSAWSTVPSRPESPLGTKEIIVAESSAVQRRTSEDGQNQIVSYLQIPSSINNSKGSLSEFAAQITCLFWFESSFTLHRVEEADSTPTPMTPLVEEAKPSLGFRKWVTTILSTTQVSQNVILLALMFIYRLKKLNPTVKGKAGSEYRLMTVALMLGNKFLDDNTYTNKTWAEVSGISVGEIHIMEVEFLSNMRYTLYASELEWASWHRKLGRFWDYFDRASRAPVHAAVPAQMLSLSNGQIALPSPPASQQASPLFIASQSNAAPLRIPNPLAAAPYLAPSIPSPVPRMPDVDLRPGKRKQQTIDFTQGLEPEAANFFYDDHRATKRFATGPTIPTSKGGLSGSINPTFRPHAVPVPPSSRLMPRLPMPNLGVSTSALPANYHGSYSANLPMPAAARTDSTNNYGHQPQIAGFGPQNGDLSRQDMYSGWSTNSSGVRIPPMNDHPQLLQTRQQLQLQPPSQPPSQLQFALNNAQQQQQQSQFQFGQQQQARPLPYPLYPLNLGSLSRRTSPTAVASQPITPVDLLTPTTSATAMAGFTYQRNSPYRPVRGVNTLLVPPPSASLYIAPQLHALAGSMHYQPLGKPGERRAGVVPRQGWDQPPTPWPAMPPPM